MHRIIALMLIAVLPFAGLWAAAGPPHQGGNLQTVFTERPVGSFIAHVDDINFIPESEFMMRTDSLDHDWNMEAVRQTEAMMFPGVQFATRPVVVCRDFGCTKLNDRITRTFLFNSLSNMFVMNQNSRLHVCEADPFTRSCLQSGITFPVRAGVASALVKIPRATINSVNLSTGLSKAMISMTYDFLVNGIAVRCEPTIADIVIPATTTATLTSREFKCNMTTDGFSNVSMLINLDYIDLDYGLLGGYYSFGLQGPTTGGGTGYAVFKMEFANRNIRAGGAGGGSGIGGAQTGQRVGMGAGAQVIRPGEYAVEALQR